MYGGASYFRKNPFGGEYTVFAGSEEAFCDYLRGLDCSDVEVYGIPEGSKPQHTYLPTIPVVKLIPSGEFPECEIQQHKDEVVAHWTRLIGGEASCLGVRGEASEGGSGGEACGLVPHPTTKDYPEEFHDTASLIALLTHQCWLEITRDKINQYPDRFSRVDKRSDIPCVVTKGKRLELFIEERPKGREKESRKENGKARATDLRLPPWEDLPKGTSQTEFSLADPEGSRSIEATEPKHKKQKKSKGDADPSVTLQTAEKGIQEGSMENPSEERSHKRKKKEKKAEGQDGVEPPANSAAGGGDGVAKEDTPDPPEELPEKAKKKKKTTKRRRSRPWKSTEPRSQPVMGGGGAEDAPLMITAPSQSAEPLKDGGPISVPKSGSGSVRRAVLDARCLTFSKEYASASNAFVKLRDRMDIVVERYDAALARSQRSIPTRNAAIRKTRGERRRGEKMRADLLEDELALAREATENVLKEKAQLEQENSRLEWEKASLAEQMTREIARLKRSQIHEVTMERVRVLTAMMS
ncbi:hypothetical protein Bca52824_033157 [Brassica carinata]|uniref:Uncharacterized protein n=1 Tax=Brassica carinata TaxID=52824 RepID=A0A8X7V977_BRACI|nr:hypothetical protein Bca52824_033157 [Brassica carinata]